MPLFRKRIFAAAGYNTVYFGSGRPEFDPSKPMPGFESYLQDAADGCMALARHSDVNEGLIGSFMAARFLNQANLPGFLPHILPALKDQPCTAIEGACGTGGRLIGMGLRSLLSNFSETVFIIGFEIQNNMKAVYGADLLAGASYYSQERKEGDAFFFPGIFARRAEAYSKRYGADLTRRGMAAWYEQAILNARKNPKAQEYFNKTDNLFAAAMTPPNPENFIPHLNQYDCSKVTDGASSILLTTELGLERCGIKKKDAIEIISIGEAQGDITQAPEDLTVLSTTAKAVHKALSQAEISIEDIGWLEVHDCFSITGLLCLEAIGLAAPGQAARYVLDGHTRSTGVMPTNMSGGLIGFGHPTGASGVRELVDLHQQLIGTAPNQLSFRKPYGMMISMGGDDKTVTCVIAQRSIS
jgi:acetyl-CoA C-acetyltransferase/acetyl-CoA acyltransferase